MGIEQRIRARAHALGFELVGLCSPDPAPRDVAAYRAWVAAGLAGEMGYMARPDRVARVVDPRGVLDGVRSIIVVGKYYFTARLPPEARGDPSRGLIASYAWGRDYHDVMAPRLRALGEHLAKELGRAVSAREYVDTGPILEREAAVRAGLGFVGNNTMLIHPRRGSWLFLGELLVDAELEWVAADRRGTCGRCVRCLVACPTDAFPEPRVLDARRCISYLTIELKGAIPRDLRSLVGNRIFGCDVCSQVCPYNRQHAQPTGDPEMSPNPNQDQAAPRLLDLIGLDDATFRARFRGTAIARPRRRGFLRNVCVALGNWGSPEAATGLGEALRDREPLIRGHAAWALGQVGSRSARAALAAVRAREPDAWVREEIELALDASDAPTG